MGRLLVSFVIVVGVAAVGPNAPEVRIGDILSEWQESAPLQGLTVDYPLDGTLFPPEIVPPTFRWTDGMAESDTWLVTIDFHDGAEREKHLCRSREWTPSATTWESMRKRSREVAATVVILGVNSSAPRNVLSGGRISFSTSADEVGAPLFYREVNLPFIDAVKDPSAIRWRFGPISSQRPPVVLEKLPVCGNCHSFSADGGTLGMDVDYANDKGSYAVVPVKEQTVLAADEIITWSDFRREDRQLTFGLLSQVSPDGRYVISTVKDRSVFVPRDDLTFSQLFFPIRGILAVYSRETGCFRALPGADDPEMVQSNPTWSPDGKYVVFARSKAYALKEDRGGVLLTKEECREFLEDGRTFLFDLYRVPFNDGWGGKAEPLAGASGNGMSNFFAKYSPDGKWIVFCKARSYMLLQPDSELYIIPAEGGEARRLRCNTARMNSWHSWSPNGKWLVFSSKANSAYTQLFLTHIDDRGHSTPPVVLDHFTTPDRAANIPEFVNIGPVAIKSIRERFIDDTHYVRAGDAYLAADDDVDGAVQEYRKALEVNPANAVAHSNLGGLLVNQGQIDEGVAHLLEAIRLDPNDGTPHYNLGMLMFRQGRAEAAISHLSSAVRLRPGVADAHLTLGVLLCNRGRLAEGAAHLSEAVRLEPDDATGHYCLGKAMTGLGQIDQAVRHLLRAVELEPSHAAACHELGMLEFGMGRTREALGHLASAVRVAPDDPQLLRDLALALAIAGEPELRDGARAVELAKRACELTDYQAVEALDVLGMAHAQAGQFPEAIEAAERALRLAHAAGNDKLAAGIQMRIALYREERPYRAPGQGAE